MAMQKKRGRGRPGFGGRRIVLHLAPIQFEVLEKEQQRLGSSRADLIRNAIMIAYTNKRRGKEWEDRQ